MRILVLCTHNSARSQMAEGFLRHFAKRAELEAEVVSAGTEKTLVKADAIKVMREAGIDLGRHRSKTLTELPDPWNFDLVLTVCDSANEACPVYPARTTRLHLSIPDPSGESLERWRSVRDMLAELSWSLVQSLVAGESPTEAGIHPRSLG
ncbi:MAG: arsenate reductase ArsC [Trueperaceae bacterium]|nr:MAG: arsenate reductase ArsC [Trueperaceae bacterium]